MAAPMAAGAVIGPAGAPAASPSAPAAALAKAAASGAQQQAAAAPAVASTSKSTERDTLEKTVAFLQKREGIDKVGVVGGRQAQRAGFLHHNNRNNRRIIARPRPSSTQYTSQTKPNPTKPRRSKSSATRAG
jgi:outer membrane receptor protein involved in Fe transport